MLALIRWDWRKGGPIVFIVIVVLQLERKKEGTHLLGWRQYAGPGGGEANDHMCW